MTLKNIWFLIEKALLKKALSDWKHFGISVRKFNGFSDRKRTSAS